MNRTIWITATTLATILAILCLGQVASASRVLESASPPNTPMYAIVDIGILVFREGLECILVLAAITASLTGAQQRLQRPIAMGAAVGFGATLVTWFIAIRILDDISNKISALTLQAATGLLAIVVLLIVMNWFFHKMYWTGWISLHNRKKRNLLDESTTSSKSKVLFGFGLLGFSSLYREGVEVVLFLQSYRLKLGSEIVLYGVLIGLLFSGLVAVLTFQMHRKLPYRKMLVFTGIMLAVVLFVMVGEQAQEMQLAHWLPTTNISWLVGKIPGWMGLWFSIFPTIETLVGQTVALVFVLGSYFVAQRSTPARTGESRNG